jgi:hypothetical protein
VQINEEGFASFCAICVFWVFYAYSVLLRFNVVLVWVSVFTHGFVICVCLYVCLQACCFMVGILVFLGGF